MNTFLWTLQILFGVLFILHGAALLAWAPPLRDSLKSAYPKGFMQFIGLCELLGGLGLILPWWLGIALILTPLAAAGLAIVMFGAIITHLRARETPQLIMNSTIFALLLVVTFVRLGGAV